MQSFLKDGILKKPKVSIIITCFNLAKYLPDLINSIENQTYKNFEVIIVNDCSNDNTKEFLDEHPEILKEIEQKVRENLQAKNKAQK